MQFELIIKLLFLAICGGMTAYSLLVIAKKKKHFQIFPDSIKKEYYKMVRNMSIANIFSAGFIALACVTFSTNIMYFFLLVSLFLSIGALYSMYDEFEEFTDSK